MEMTAAEWMSALGQTALVVVISFVALCLITSFVRFQLMTEAAQESHELGLGEEKSFRLVVMNRIAAARKAREPITVMMLRIPPDGAGRDVVEAKLKSLLRRDDTIIPCGPDLIGMLLLCGSDRAEVVARRITAPDSVAGLPGADRWHFGVAGYPEHGYKTSELYPRAMSMLEEAEKSGKLIAGMESAEAVAEDKTVATDMVDALTGLVREDKMIYAMRRYIANARRVDKPASVIFIDVDPPARTTEAASPEITDDVLKELADFIDSQFREKDLLCRVGPTGFVAGLVVTPENAVAVVQRAAASVRKHVFKAGQATKITISAGVAGFPDVQGTAMHYCIAAETALKQARVRGRNQIVRYEPSMQVTAVQAEAPVDRL